MEVVLSSEFERLIHDRVSSGEYSSASDVIEEALRLLVAEEEYERKLDALRREIQIGIDELDRGEYSSAEEVFARLRARRGRHEEVDDDEGRSSGSVSEGLRVSPAARHTPTTAS